MLVDPLTRGRRWKHGGKLSNGSGAEKRVNSTQHPNRDDEPRTSQLGCDFARRAQDARADRASNTHSNTKTYAHNAVRLA